MRDILLPYYLWFKLFHLFSMVSWMAALLYLPRLFVYHSRTMPTTEASNLFIIMERRLSRIIMSTGMILTFFFGGLLVYIQPHLLLDGWLHLKLALVTLLAGFHFFLIYCRNLFACNKRPYSERFFIVVNEFPAFALLGILFLVLFRPF